MVAGRSQLWLKCDMRSAPMTVPTNAKTEMPIFFRYSICSCVDHVEPTALKKEPTLIFPTITPNATPGKSHCISGTEKNIPPPSTTLKIPTTKPPPIKIRELESNRKLSDDSSTVVFHFATHNRADCLACEFLADESRIFRL